MGELASAPGKYTLPLLHDLISQKTGLCYADGREFLLADKIAALVEDSGFESPLDYYYYLKYSRDSAGEWLRLQNALSVQETYFWREHDQILAAARVLAPQAMQRHPERPVRIWHAGAASGEEPYSMAMALIEAGSYRKGAVEIIATDFNEEALESARKGIYRARSFRALPHELAERYFTRLPNGQQELTEPVKKMVDFRYLNLLDEEAMSQMQDFDIIFCRNVFIYFSDEAILKTTAQFHAALRNPAHLFVAAAESLIRLTTKFNLVEIEGAFAYEK